MPYHDDPSGKFKPYLFHNIDQSIETFDGTSVFNRVEANYVIDLFEELVTKYPQHSNNIGIIAPYKAQRKLLNALLKERFKYNGNMKHSDRPKLSYDDLDTEISTIDGFQGREKNIVIFSCVRAPQSNDNNRKNTTGIGFLKEWQRLNVAVTRSRYALWIVGHNTTLSNDPEWKNLLDYTLSRDCIYNAAAVAIDANDDLSGSSSRVRNDNQRQDGKVKIANKKSRPWKNKHRKVDNGRDQTDGKNHNRSDHHHKQTDNSNNNNNNNHQRLESDHMEANELIDRRNNFHSSLNSTTTISNTNNNYCNNVINNYHKSCNSTTSTSIKIEGNFHSVKDEIFRTNRTDASQLAVNAVAQKRKFDDYGNDKAVED